MKRNLALTTMHQHDRFERSKRYRNDPESSTAPHSAYGEPVSLNLDTQIFISHSGMNKDFARLLHRDLCRCYRGTEVAFLDETTLPKGEAISMGKSILEVARGSLLGVLVLTDDFFTQTPNPMLELEAFVASKVKLLPLFLTLSVEEFKKAEQWDRWQKKWEEWHAADDKLAIENWRSYLEVVRKYNGLEFCKIAPNGRQDLYIDEVVKQVVCIVGPVDPMSRKDVCGKDRLCKMVDNLYSVCTSKRSSSVHRTATQIASSSASPGLAEANDSRFYAYDLVGIHGFPGLGKTTLCKCLRDFYFSELTGRVCHVDLGSDSTLDHLQKMLSCLDWGNRQDIHKRRLDSDQVKNLLMQRLSSMKDPVFLAIDNITEKSQEEALIYLRWEFPKGSKILITAQAEAILRNLIGLLPLSCGSLAVIEYMPALKFEEAREIFEQAFPDLESRRHLKISAIEEDLRRDVDMCVHKCTIFNGCRYHPLMLKSLARFLKWDDLAPHLDWKGRLAKLASKGITRNEDAWEKLFEVFDITYKLLDEEAKKVFLDLALCYNSTIDSSVKDDIDYYDWIKMLHRTYRRLSEQKLEKILSQLHKFCFIVKNGGPKISFHTSMVDFGKHKADQMMDHADSDGYLVLEDEAQWPDILPRNVRHISISRWHGKGASGKLDLRHLEGVRVLHLLDNAGLTEVLLSSTTSTQLRSMIVSSPACTALRCILSDDWSSQSLKWVTLKGNVELCCQPSLQPAAQKIVGSAFLGGFRNLESLSLDSLMLGSSSSVQIIDLTPCDNLKRLTVRNMPGLKSIRGPEKSNLDDVYILDSPHLEELTLTLPANSEAEFIIADCASLKRACFRSTPSISYAGYLTILDCPLVAAVDVLSLYSRYYFEMSYEALPRAQQDRFWRETFVDMVKQVTGFDVSRCTARVTKFNANIGTGKLNSGYTSILCLEDAQHIGPFIPALLQTLPGFRKTLTISCDGLCGCDNNAPNFSTPIGVETPLHLEYCCRQVRDLSGLSQCHGLKSLSLKGCANVEVWPDFGAMTSLSKLDLSDTSLREWPVGLHLLPHLKQLCLRGCRQLPTKELIFKAIIHTNVLHSCCSPTDTESFRSEETIWRMAMRNVAMDLLEMRDKRTAAHAICECATYLDRRWLHGASVQPVLELIWEVWCMGSDIRAEMRGLLSSESFLSLPVCAYSPEVFLDTLTKAMIIASVGSIALEEKASSAHDFSWAVLAGNDNHLKDSTIAFFGRIKWNRQQYWNRNDNLLKDNTIAFFGRIIKWNRQQYWNRNGSTQYWNTEWLKSSSTSLTVKKEKLVRAMVEVALSTILARKAHLEVHKIDLENEEMDVLRDSMVADLCAVVVEGVNLGGLKLKIYLENEEMDVAGLWAVLFEED